MFAGELLSDEMNVSRQIGSVWPLIRWKDLDQDLSLNRVSASFHTRREGSLECVDTLLVRGLCLGFLLLLLLGSGLRRLLFGCFVSSPLLCSTRHRPGHRSGACSLTCFIVSDRSNRGTSSGAPGSTLYSTPFCLLGIVRSGLLLCFLLLLGLGDGRRSLGVNSRLLFG